MRILSITTRFWILVGQRLPGCPTSSQRMRHRVHIQSREKRSSRGCPEEEDVPLKHSRPSRPVEGVTYSLPHQAKVVTDSAGTELFLEYKGRKVADA